MLRICRFLGRTVSSVALLVTVVAHAQTTSFKHVVVIVQENRTPDNLFQGLCVHPFGQKSSCSTSPLTGQYNIQTSNWLDKGVPGGKIQPFAVPLANNYDLAHESVAFDAMCNPNASGTCQMDGAAAILCHGTCPSNPQFAYVDNSTGILNPYLQLATQYGWANYMFQTNQGGSFPAHQFLFSGTSAPSAADDKAGIFASTSGNAKVVGCTALAGTTVELITPTGTRTTYPCFEHATMADLLDPRGISWKYYAPDGGSPWTAPNAIRHLCQPNSPTAGQCIGPDWNQDVILYPSKVFTDISNCNLADVTWVIPSGPHSDHALSNTGGGPDWVSSIVNTIGNNPKCSDGEIYWKDTAILITWDDWGGWYDHEAPVFLAPPQNDNEYGFRVPLIVVSAFTPPHYISNSRFDFGSVLRFIEQNFKIPLGALNFADARAKLDLTEFFQMKATPRSFETVPTAKSAQDFLDDKSPLEPPDND